MLSQIMARFSSALVRSTSLTWKSELLPTIVIVLARESNSDRRPSSSSAFTPLRRVMPKAQTRTCFKGKSQTCWKYWASFSFEAGYPPST